MKYKSFKSLWWIIKLQIITSKLFFVWSIFFSLYSGLASIIATFAIAKLITAVTAVSFQQASVKEVYTWLACLLFIQLIDVIITNSNRLIDRRFQQKIELATNEQFMRKMYSLSQEQFENEEFNTKLSRAKDGLFQMSGLLRELSWLISTIVSFFGSIIAIIIVSPMLGLIISIISLPLTYMRIKQNNTNEKIYKDIEPLDRVAFRSRWVLIDPNSMPEVRLINAFNSLLSSWKVNLKKSQKMMFNNDKKLALIDVLAEAIPPIVNFFANIYVFRLLVAGLVGLDKFIFLRGIIQQSGSSAGQLGSSMERMHELSINLRNFSDIYETEPAVPRGTVKVKQPLTIEFKNVSFTYPGTKQLILDNVSFVVMPGSRLALVGENGAGKSTLLKLLLRQYLPQKGTITVNGIDMKNVDQESYYNQLSNLSQDFLIVNHLTIKDNLLMGLSRRVTDKEIMEVASLTGASSFISKLPNKLNQRLDSSFDDGSGLSGGQLQRLGVTRSLLRNGDLMILDEPTSAIDAKAEYMIFNNIYRMHANKTTLIVSHRFSTVRKADKIIVMEQGKITEYGSHDELLKHNGLYKEMFETQAEGYK